MRALFIIVYFGKLPQWFSLYLLSCSYNKDFDWLILTDDHTAYITPENVKIERTTLSRIKKFMTNRLKMRISLDSPYKLCDYRPAYGYIFQDYLKDYDYWGYTDLDLIYGNLKNFIDLNQLNHYSKIQARGHLTLFKNSDEVNRYFMLRAAETVSYKEVFSTNRYFDFDEMDGINVILSKFHIPYYHVDSIADISPDRTAFNTITLNVKMDYLNQVFVWDNGKVFGIFLNQNNQMCKQEFEYIHFQKRKFTRFLDRKEVVDHRFLINHQGFITNIDLKEKDIFNYSIPTVSERVLHQQKRIFQRLSRKSKVLTTNLISKISGNQ